MSESLRERCLTSIFGERRHKMTDTEKNAAIETVQWLEKTYGVTFLLGDSMKYPVPVDIPLVEKHMNTVMDGIRTALSDLYGITVEELFDGSRKRDSVILRDCCYEVMAKFAWSSESRIAGLFGVNHSTVHHARQVLRDWCAYDSSVRKIYNEFHDAVAENVGENFS